MRILHIIAGPGAGGAEIYIKDLAKSLSKRGHEIYIGFWGRASDFGRNPTFEKEFLRELDAINIKYFFIGYETRKKPWLGAWRVRRFVRDHNIDIYHSHMLFGIFFGSLIRIPRIYTHHNIRIQASRSLFGLIFNRLVDYYVGISTACAKKLANHTGRTVTTIFNGVDLQKYPEERLVRHSKGILQCIAVGGLQPQKNYFLLVDAVSHLSSELKSRLRILIAGEGASSYSDRLVSYIDEKQLSENIVLLGNRGDIPELLAASQLFIMSSAWEGLPISLLEATISGLPSIVTNVGGCPEVIEMCKSGLIVSSEDPREMTYALSSLIVDRNQLTAYSFNAIQNSPIFSIENAATDHIKLYLNAVRDS